MFLKYYVNTGTKTEATILKSVSQHLLIYRCVLGKDNKNKKTISFYVTSFKSTSREKSKKNRPGQRIIPLTSVVFIGGIFYYILILRCNR